MDHFREIKNKLAWHKEGKFEVELVNGVIKHLNFCEPGTGPDGLGKCLTSTNYKFLQNVYDCLGELFTFIEEENKRMGYRYARQEEHPHVYHTVETEEELIPASEAKLRPLMSYEIPAADDDRRENIELTA